MTISLQQAISVLRAHRNALRAKGVRRAAVFGSTARGDALPDSDLDILIDIDPDWARGVFGLVALQNDVKDLFDGEVDVVALDGLKPAFLKRIAPDIVYIF